MKVPHVEFNSIAWSSASHVVSSRGATFYSKLALDLADWRWRIC